MAITKRTRNLAKNEVASTLKGNIGKNNDLSFIPEGFISRTVANRKYKLSDKDLSKLDASAVTGTKRGQVGIFYRVADVRVLSEGKPVDEQNPQNLIPETAIRRQIPKWYYDARQLDGFWKYGINTVKNGRKGNYFTKEILEDKLGLHVIESQAKEGIDFIQESRVRADMKTYLPDPKLCIWSDHSSGPGMMQPCFVGPDIVEQIKHLKDNDGLIQKRSSPR